MQIDYIWFSEFSSGSVSCLHSPNGILRTTDISITSLVGWAFAVLSRNVAFSGSLVLAPLLLPRV